MLSAWVERFGETEVLLAGGLVIGILFGAMAQRSQFCLRAAALEFWHRKGGGKLVIWLLAFSSAVLITQGLIATGQLDVSNARQLAAAGSLSGAMVGGLIFGAGMVMARGCVSRLLVLSAQGNLRALLTGMIVAVSAQASLHGVLEPARLWLAQLWPISGPARDLLAFSGLGRGLAFLIGGLWLASAFVLMKRVQRNVPAWLLSAGVGATVPLAWWFSWSVSKEAFDVVVPVQSITFSGPSADLLMSVLTPTSKFSFGHGLVPGVVIGSFVSAALGRQLKLEGFHDGASMRRYIAGGVLMGFGGMLAGGCAVGAGVTGASIFALTAWVALFSMWVGAGLTDAWLDRPQPSQPSSDQSGAASRPAHA